MLFHCAPEDPYEKWDKVWLDRARVILQGRYQASLDTNEKKSIDGE